MFVVNEIRSSINAYIEEMSVSNYLNSYRHNWVFVQLGFCEFDSFPSL